MFKWRCTTRSLSRKETLVASRARKDTSKEKEIKNRGLDASSSTDPVDSALEMPGCVFKGPLFPFAGSLLVGSHGFCSNGNNQLVSARVLFFWLELIPSPSHISVIWFFFLLFCFFQESLYSQTSPQPCGTAPSPHTPLHHSARHSLLPPLLSLSHQITQLSLQGPTGSR